MPVFRLIIVSFITLLIFTVPDATLAQSTSKFVPMAGVPGLTTGQSYSLPQLLNALYRMLIVLGAFYAVIKISLAGFSYMSSDSIGNKSKAKEDIKYALLGLLLILSTVLIVSTITGKTVSLDVLGPRSAPDIKYPSRTQSLEPKPLSPTGSSRTPQAAPGGQQPRVMPTGPANQSQHPAAP